MRLLYSHKHLNPNCDTNTFTNAKHITGRDPKNLTLWQRTPFSAPMAEAQLSACMVQSQILTCRDFLKSSNSQTISSGHDVIHTPAHFPSGGLL